MECRDGLLGRRPRSFLRHSSSASLWWHEKQLNSDNSGQGDVPHEARRRRSSKAAFVVAS